MSLIVRVILAVIVAIVVGLVCLFVGTILATLKVPIAETVGGLLVEWGWVIGVIAGLWYFFSGGELPSLPGRKT